MCSIKNLKIQRLNCGMYQDMFAAEFIDMFPRTNGDILVHTILARIDSL
mgnify:FL=1|jgi:hypothetical protein